MSFFACHPRFNTGGVFLISIFSFLMADQHLVCPDMPGGKISLGATIIWILAVLAPLVRFIHDFIFAIWIFYRIRVENNYLIIGIIHKSIHVAFNSFYNSQFRIGLNNISQNSETTPCSQNSKRIYIFTINKIVPCFPTLFSKGFRYC